jgi:3-oxoacyl-[acyl-carrier-protein] synthase III
MNEDDLNNLLNGGDEDENINNDIFPDEFDSECHHRLLLDTLNSRSNTISNLINCTTNFLFLINKKKPFWSKVKNDINPETVKKVETYLDYLMEKSKITLNQIDYFVSRTIDESYSDTIIEGEEDNEKDGSK